MEMSLVAVLVGIVVGLVQPLRRAVAAAVATWALTTAYLAFVAGSSGGGDSQSHGLTPRFWVLQVALLLVALAATWAASRLRASRVAER